MSVRVFDAHLHIINPRFPLVPNNGYVPEAFTVDDYMARTGELGGRVMGRAKGRGRLRSLAVRWCRGRSRSLTRRIWWMRWNGWGRGLLV